MRYDTRTLALFAAAAALRLLLFTVFPSLPALLTSRVEISTPVTSFKRLQEGLFLYQHNVSPYDGGVFHQAPLLLPIFSLLPEYRLAPLATDVIYVLLDLLSASALMQIAATGEAHSSRLFTSPRKAAKWSNVAIGAAFLFNPFTVATCIGRPSNVFTNCAILQAVAAATRGNVAKSILALSVASYISLYPVLLAPPLALLAHGCRVRDTHVVRSANGFLIRYCLAIAGTISGLLLVSYSILGSSWAFLVSTYGVQLTLSDLSPNVGLWWYFFVEMFDSFRNFFLGVFWLHITSYVGAMTIRLRKQPLAAITGLLGVFMVFKPYPSIADAALFFALVPLYRHVFPLLRYSFIAVAAVVYSTFLGPAFYYLWIYAGSGNANFFYAITLVYALGLTIVVHDLIFAILRDEFEVERPELKGRDIVQI